MSDAHVAIFRLLDDFCSSRSDPIHNAGEQRFIAGPSNQEKEFLKKAAPELKLEFTSSRRVILYEYQNQSFFGLVGFENSQEFSGLAEVSINGGNLAAVLADLKPKPIASTAAIRNVVEAQDRRLGEAYKGHPQKLIGALFPLVRLYVGPRVGEDEAYRIFFRFCLLECQHDDYWISSGLASTLIQLCDVDSLKIPYQTLCRCIFDADPGALFLGLYRCIEALYACKTTVRLAKELNVDILWSEMCVVLENRLGWRAPEAASLNRLLQFGNEDDLKSVLTALGKESDLAMPSLANSAGKQIYSLRNALVHFRPIHHRTEYNYIDWNRLCGAMACLVRSIYEKSFLEVNQDESEMFEPE